MVQGTLLKECRSSPSRRQQGAALVVGLVLLVIVTLLGVTSLRTVTQEQRMSANQQDRQLAFQRAEQSLREGEAQLIQNPSNFTNANRLADPTGNWVGTALPGQPPASYHVGPPEAQRRVQSQDPSLDLDPSSQRCWNVHLVHARAEGRSTDSSVILRSIHLGDKIQCQGQ